MKTLEINQLAGSDGLLHLTVPVEHANRQYHVLVVVDEPVRHRSKSAWPEGFFERTAGAWIGDFPQDR